MDLQEQAQVHLQSDNEQENAGKDRLPWRGPVVADGDDDDDDDEFLNGSEALLVKGRVEK